MAPLKRVFSSWSLTIYGIGSILGAGIYTVIGKVAGTSGDYLWISFLIAMVLSLLTAFSYAEMSHRFPSSGAESNFTQQAFGRKWLSSLAGWLVACASIVSMATLSHAFAGYFREIWSGLPPWVLYVLFLGILGGINLSGIEESARANFIATLIEFSGLVIVLITGILFLTQGEAPREAAPSSSSSPNWIGIFQGVSLAFFAFIGFEDLVNVADEVKKPERSIPIAITVAPVVAGLLYLSVAWVSVHVVPSSLLMGSDSPLLEVVKKGPLPIPKMIFNIIALFAVSNTTLLNSITASRLLYGMSRQGLMPKWLQKVHSTRQTPYVAIGLVIPTAIFLALIGNLRALAETTSLVLLSIFLLISLSLIVIKRREKTKKGGFRIPLVFPCLAVVANLLVISFVPWKSQLGALTIIVVGLILSFFYQRSHRPSVSTKRSTGR